MELGAGSVKSSTIAAAGTLRKAVSFLLDAITSELAANVGLYNLCCVDVGLGSSGVSAASPSNAAAI